MAFIAQEGRRAFMIRVGIAGIGYIAEEYIKLFSQGKIKNAELHALSSRNYAHMEEIKNTYHLTDATLFSDYNAMLASSGIDMVIVCTPHFCHPDMAIRSIERGIHTLIEKPVGVFPEELETLRLCCARHPDIRSGVLYCRRGNKAFIKLKELTDSGFIGEMKRVTWIVTDMYRPKAYFDAYPWKGTFREEGGGLLMTQVSHQIDLLVWLCGLPSARRNRAVCRFFPRVSRQQPSGNHRKPWTGGSGKLQHFNSSFTAARRKGLFFTKQRALRAHSLHRAAVHF